MLTYLIIIIIIIIIIITIGNVAITFVGASSRNNERSTWERETVNTAAPPSQKNIQRETARLRTYL